MVAWVRGPGSVWKALPCASAGCSVREAIYRHCQELVRIAVSGRGGKEIAPSLAGFVVIGCVL